MQGAGCRIIAWMVRDVAVRVHDGTLTLTRTLTRTLTLLTWMMATWPCACTMEVLHWSLPEMLARKKHAW